MYTVDAKILWQFSFLGYTQPWKLNQRIDSMPKIELEWYDKLHKWLPSSLASWLEPDYSTTIFLLSSSHSAANGSTQLQKKSTDAWCLLWQMANDSSIFLNSNGISVMKITWF